MSNKLKQTLMTFRQVNGTYRRVDSREVCPLTLADCLKDLSIIIDDDAQFCRIIRQYNKIKQEITYRVYGGEITITITTY